MFFVLKVLKTPTNQGELLFILKYKDIICLRILRQ